MVGKERGKTAEKVVDAKAADCVTRGTADSIPPPARSTASPRTLLFRKTFLGEIGSTGQPAPAPGWGGTNSNRGHHDWGDAPPWLMYKLLIADSGDGGDDDDGDGGIGGDDRDNDENGEGSNEGRSNDRAPSPLPLSSVSRGVESVRLTNGSTVPAPESRGIGEQPEFTRWVEADRSRPDLCESSRGFVFRLWTDRGSK